MYGSDDLPTMYSYFKLYDLDIETIRMYHRAVERDIVETINEASVIITDKGLSLTPKGFKYRGDGSLIILF